MLNYKLIEAPVKGVSIYQVEDLKIRVMENYTPTNNIADRTICSEIEINNNRILFEPLNMFEYSNLVLQGDLLRSFIDDYKSRNQSMTKLKKFDFYDTDFKVIRHNVEPRFILQVIQNDNYSYDKWNDVYDLFEFRGNQFALVVFQSEVDLEEVEDFRQIRSIIKRAFNWYKSQLHIEKYTPTSSGIMEDDRFILQEGKMDDWWVCTDKHNKIVCEFKNGLFNETQKITPLEALEPSYSIMEVSRIMREIADWLVENHNEKL